MVKAGEITPYESYQLSSLCLYEKFWHEQISAFSRIFLNSNMWPYLFLFRQNNWNICSVTKKLIFLFIKGRGKLACGWRKWINTQLIFAHANAYIAVLWKSPVMIITRIIRKMHSIAYQTPSVVNCNLAPNYFEFQKKGSTLTLRFSGKMKIRFIFSTSFR